MTTYQTVLETINNDSITFYYLLNHHKIKKQMLYQALKQGKTDFLKEKEKTVDKDKKQFLENQYTKRDCLEDTLIQSENRFSHLKEIQEIVNIDSIIEQVVTDSIYEKKRNLYFTDFILDSLVEEFYDYESIQFLAKLKQEILEKNKKLNRQIEKNIRYFYIQKITI